MSLKSPLCEQPANHLVKLELEQLIVLQEKDGHDDVPQHNFNFIFTVHQLIVGSHSTQLAATVLLAASMASHCRVACYAGIILGQLHI